LKFQTQIFGQNVEQICPMAPCIVSVSGDVDTDAFLKKWDEILDNQKPFPHTCVGVGKRSMDRRCSQKRAWDDWEDDDFPLDTLPDNNSSLIIRDFDVHTHDLDDLEKRIPFALLLSVIAQFAGRMGVQLIARVSAAVTVRNSRIQGLVNAGTKIFQSAPTGQGTKAGVKGMQNAKSSIMKDKRWINCLKNGLP
jgi:hypothetical protein